MATPSSSNSPARPTDVTSLDDFDAAVLGHGLPPAAEQALREAGLLRHDPPAEMAALMRAQALAPEHPAVAIAFYRFHFYGHRLPAARGVARQALVIGARALGLPTVWREVPAVALPNALDHAPTRFYLWVLKGYAYLSLRLDDPVEARDALAKLRALDPGDVVGGALLDQAIDQFIGNARGAKTADHDGGAVAHVCQCLGNRAGNLVDHGVDSSIATGVGRHARVKMRCTGV